MEVIYNFTDDKTARLANAYKTNKPKFSEHHGRTWDSLGDVTSNNVIIPYIAVTTWGIYGYFQKDNQWYKFKFYPPPKASS